MKKYHQQKELQKKQQKLLFKFIVLDVHFKH